MSHPFHDSCRCFLLAYACPLLLGGTVQAADFHKDVLPIFEKKCASCHSEKKGKKPKGGYVFDEIADIKSNIGSSFLIRPNDAGNSDLMGMVTRANKDHPMPPDDKDALSAGEIKKLREWIEAGAEIPDKSGKGSTSGSSSATTSKLPAAVPVEDWTSSDGKSIKASLVKCMSGIVVLRLANGKNAEIPLSRLNQECQERAIRSVKNP
jgi:hypothetical protein